MHITLEADYAIRIVTTLAGEGGRLDAKSIAERSSVTIRFALKILRKLVNNNIIKSFKGTQGGYELVKPPSEITVREVIETVEGTYCFSRCLHEGYPCNNKHKCNGDCAQQKLFNEISDLVREKLDSYTFDMLIENNSD